MATNQTGIAIVIKAFLPTGKTLDETYAALTVVKTAHESGDYAPLLSVAKIDEVKTEQKTRRFEEAAAAEPDPDFAEVEGVETAEEVLAQGEDGTDDVAGAEDIPAFLKSKKTDKAA